MIQKQWEGEVVEHAHGEMLSPALPREIRQLPPLWIDKKKLLVQFMVFSMQLSQGCLLTLGSGGKRLWPGGDDTRIAEEGHLKSLFWSFVLQN